MAKGRDAAGALVEVVLQRVLSGALGHEREDEDLERLGEYPYAEHEVRQRHGLAKRQEGDPPVNVRAGEA